MTRVRYAKALTKGEYILFIWLSNTIFSESWVCSPICDVCKLQRRGLDFVAGSNLTAILWEALRGLWWGQVFWNMSAHEKNGSAQWRPLSHFHSFVHLSLLFTAWLSLVNHWTGCTQSTKCPCVISHLPSLHFSLFITPSTVSFFWKHHLTPLHWPFYSDESRCEASPGWWHHTHLMRGGSTCLHNDPAWTASLMFPLPFPFSLLLQKREECADKTAPQFPVLVLMKLVVISMALPTAGILSFFSWLCTFAAPRKWLVDLMHQLPHAAGVCT